MSLMGKRGNEAEEGCGKSLLLFVSSGFFSPYHIKKNIIIKEYQIKFIYKYFFWQMSANSRDKPNEHK